MTTDNRAPQDYWNERYAESGQIWSGRPNQVLVEETSDLEPGRALDLGCGEGGDAIWLAKRGWNVTAVDVSSVALSRAAAHVEAAGVADRIEWQQHELGKSFPDGSYDLVSAQFLHSLAELPREDILRAAAKAVAPGGILLIEGHLGFPSWHGESHPEVHFPKPAEVIEDLRLEKGEWEILVSREHEREHADPEGEPTTRLDCTVKVRRRP